jgi:hypothetical protein
MKKLSLLLITCTVLFISNKTFSQGWMPEPIKSPYLDAIVGTWTSSPYMFMGNTNQDIVTYNMILNGQFLEIDVKRTDDKGFTYEGKEIVIPSPDGTMKGSFYDIFGKDQSSSYYGKMDGNKIILTSASPVGTGTREIIIDGDTMIHNVTFVMMDKSGKQTPEQKITITYKKAN